MMMVAAGWKCFGYGKVVIWPKLFGMVLLSGLVSLEPPTSLLR